MLAISPYPIGRNRKPETSNFAGALQDRITGDYRLFLFYPKRTIDRTAIASPRACIQARAACARRHLPAKINFPPPTYSRFPPTTLSLFTRPSTVPSGLKKLAGSFRNFLSGSILKILAGSFCCHPALPAPRATLCVYRAGETSPDRLAGSLANPVRPPGALPYPPLSYPRWRRATRTSCPTSGLS